MRRSIATVSLSGMLREKLQAIAAARFDGVEIFENDLLQFSGKPREVRTIAADLGLAIDMFQPFRDFDGATQAHVARSLERMEHKFDTMEELGARLVLVCSSVLPDAPGEVSQLAEQFALLAERAGQRGMTVAFEALAWGTRIRRFAQAWEVVRAVDHPSFGLALDSFHTLSLRDDPQPIALIPGDRIVYVQLADAPWVSTDVLTHSRHHRCFPGQGEFDLVGFMNALLDSGYRGTISLEIFNDEFRSAPANANALDAMRSLLWLEEEVRASRPDRGGRVALFAPPAKPRCSGWAFIEFAADPSTSDALGAYLLALGFRHLGRHRSKDVLLYGAGDVRLVINREGDSFARGYFDLHGASVCALALATEDAATALAHAQALLCTPFAGRVGPGELTIPAVAAPDGSLLYFCQAGADGHARFEADFVLERDTAKLPLWGCARVDHIVRALPRGQTEPWLLFERTVLGLVSQRSVVLHDPYGAVRSRELESDDKIVRTSLVVSERENTAVARAVERFGGAGVQQIAIAVDDVVALVAELRRHGAPLLTIPDNYYDDLAAKYELEATFIAVLRSSGVLYERGPQGEFLHAYAAPFDDRFEFEFVERRGAYPLYGASNAPVRLAALAEWRAKHS